VRGRDGDVQLRPIEADPRGRITGPIIRAKVNRAG
jgi:hypothetical protein